MRTIAIILANGFEEVEALTQADFLRRAGIPVQLVGLNSTTITGGHDIVVQADAVLDAINAEDLDGIVLPGGMPGAENLAASAILIDLVKDLFSRGRLVAAICAAPAVVLQKTGVITGKKVTCYPGFEKRFHNVIFKEDRVVRHDNLITSRGPGTAAEMAIEIIRYVAGDAKANQIHAATLQK